MSEDIREVKESIKEIAGIVRDNATTQGILLESIRNVGAEFKDTKEKVENIRKIITGNGKIEDGFCYRLNMLERDMKSIKSVFSWFARHPKVIIVLIILFISMTGAGGMGVVNILATINEIKEVLGQ